MVLRRRGTSSRSMSAMSSCGAKPAWATTSPSGLARIEWPTPTGPSGLPAFTGPPGRAASTAAMKHVESSARADTSVSHWRTLPGPSFHDAGSTITSAPRCASSTNCSGNRMSKHVARPTRTVRRTSPPPTGTSTTTSSEPGATVSDSRNPKASKSRILS